MVKSGAGNNQVSQSGGITSQLFSGFRKRSQEEFYDMLTCKLVELLCSKMLATPTMREVLLSKSHEKDASEMAVWVKKIGKIFRTMLLLERSKKTQPIVSSTFANLIECLRSGSNSSYLEFPLSSVNEHDESSNNTSNSRQKRRSKQD